MKNDIAAQGTSIAFFYYQSKHFLTAKTGCLETPEKWTIFKVEELDWPRASEPHASQVLSAPLATHSTLLLRKKRGKTFDLAQQFHMLQASGKIVLTGLIWILWPYSNTVFEKHRKSLNLNFPTSKLAKWCLLKVPPNTSVSALIGFFSCWIPHASKILLLLSSRGIWVESSSFSSLSWLSLAVVSSFFRLEVRFLRRSLRTVHLSEPST